jgi:hypothetical protein
MSAISLDDQVKEVKREIAMRKRVYPRWVAQGKMDKALADKKLAIMEAALATLEDLQAKVEALDPRQQGLPL